VRLWHRTDKTGRDGIAAFGFTQEDPPVGPSWTSPDRGRVWFAISKDVARQTASRSGWWVSIEVPEGTQEHLLDGGERYLGNYALSIEYVNGLDFNFEEGD
jgi:hypothetical protein